MDFNCNFSLKHYFEVLDHAKKSYAIGPIKELHKLQKKNQFLIMRHDVDFSIDQALEMAKLESEHNICSTYFILLHSPYYNALSEQNIKKIRKFLELGHEIGLHYDTILTENNNQILKMVNNEANLLSNMIGEEIISIAPHNVSMVIKKIDHKNIKFIDATNPKILNSVKYISDSVQNWRDGCMCNHIDRKKKLIILTHPIWWQKYHNSRNSILQKFEESQIKTINELLKETKKLQEIYLKKLQKR